MKPTIFVIFHYDVVMLGDHRAFHVYGQHIVFTDHDGNTTVDFDTEADANAAMAEVKKGLVEISRNTQGSFGVATIVVQTPQERADNRT